MVRTKAQRGPNIARVARRPAQLRSPPVAFDDDESVAAAAAAAAGTAESALDESAASSGAEEGPDGPLDLTAPGSSRASREWPDAISLLDAEGFQPVADLHGAVGGIRGGGNPATCYCTRGKISGSRASLQEFFFWHVLSHLKFQMLYRTARILWSA